MINGLSGTLGDAAFNGWASVDLASKPLVKLDLDFQRLDLGGATPRGASGAQPWSNATFDLSGLNYVDAQVRASAAELMVGGAQFAPAAIDATLASGVLKVRFSNLGAYGGQANGEVTADASAAEPSFALRSDLTGVRALPLLSSVADFDKLDGKMQAKIAVRSTGASPRAIMSNLNGTVFTVFQDGAIRGLNVAKMIRSLTSGTLSGWQEGAGPGHRPQPTLGLVQDRQGPGRHHRSQSGRPAGEDDRHRHHRPRHQADRVPGRAEAGADHRGPGPRRRSGRARHSRDDRRAVGRAAHLSRYGRHAGQSRCGLCQAEGDGQGPVRQGRRRTGRPVGRPERRHRQRPAAARPAAAPRPAAD